MLPPIAQAPAAAGGGLELGQHGRAVLASFPVVDVVAPDSRVLRNADGYYDLKPEEKAGNPFEKVRALSWPAGSKGQGGVELTRSALGSQLKLARDPLKHLVHLNEVAALAGDVASRGFAAVDDGDKEREAELDHRLKWLGLFHKRKHHYGRFMMRLKLPGGFVSAPQLRVLAEAIAKYGDDGCADITTRQNIQLRGIELPDVPALLASFEAVGMTSLQSGLDNVRNAVGNPLAGIDPQEVMDSRPATDALHAYVTNRGQGNPEISNLPRKWNVCVVGSHELWEHPHINDLAYLPAERDGVAGYNIIVGGYISVQRAIESIPLDVWVPAGDDVVSLCHAVLTLFRDYGTRGNRQKCRMMWLVEEMGVEKFRAEVAARMPAGTLARAAEHDLLRKDWERRSYLGVHEQKQAGLSWVGCSVPGGRLEAADMAAFADLAERYGSGEVRLTVEQNIIISDVPSARLPELLKEPLLEAFTPFPGRIMGGLVACTGNQFCGFSQIETKQTAWRVAEHLESVLDMPRDIRMMWTGCPNSCGQVQVADIGLMGCMVKAPAGQTVRERRVIVAAARLRVLTLCILPLAGHGSRCGCVCGRPRGRRLAPGDGDAPVGAHGRAAAAA